MDTKGVGAVVVLVLLGVFAMLFGGWPALAHNGAVQDNVQTTGVVTSTDVDMKVTEDSDGNTERKYRPVIEYEYTVAGETHAHDNVFPGSFTRWDGSESRAERIAADYQPGQEVDVFYNPRDSTHAYVRDDGMPSTWWAGVGYGVVALLGGGWLVRVGFRRRRQRSLMEDTPTEQAESLSMGPSEIQGTASLPDGGPAQAPFTDDECVVAKWKIEEYREDRDDDGGGSWTTVEAGVRQIPFYVDDGTGAALVRPYEDATYDLEGEDWTTVEVDSSSNGPEPVQAFVDGTESVDYPSNGGGRDGDRRYKQNLIRPDEDVYVFGTVQPLDDGTVGTDNVDNLVIEKVDEDDPRMEPMFMISDDSERDLVSKRRWALWRIPVGVVFVVFGLGLVLAIAGPTVGIELPTPPQLLG